MGLGWNKVCPHFHLATVLLLFPAVGLLLWANLTQRIVVSRPFDLGPIESCVDVYVSDGWPVSHRFCQILVFQKDVDGILREVHTMSDLPRVLGAEMPEVGRGRLAINVAVGLSLVCVVAVGSEVVIRWVERGRRQIRSCICEDGGKDKASTSTKEYRQDGRVMSRRAVGILTGKPRRTGGGGGTRGGAGGSITDKECRARSWLS